MTLRRALIALALAWAAMLVCVAPARADALSTLSRLCGYRGEAIAALVQEAAERYNLNADILAAMVFAESSCKRRATNKKTGAIGLAAILLGGAAPLWYNRAMLFRPRVNLDFGAQYLALMLGKCGDYAGAISRYAGFCRCASTRWSRRVLALAEQPRS